VSIAVRVRGIGFTDELRNAAETIVGFATDHYTMQVDDISLQLSDLNGPRAVSIRFARLLPISGEPILF
jgi:hypothetical protein